MKMTKPQNSEFALYESIVSGKLRPFLPEYSSDNYIESLAEIQKYDQEIGKLFSEEKDLWDNFEVEDLISEEEKLLDDDEESEPLHLGLDFQKELPELEKELLFCKYSWLEIPRPPDEKSEYFLSLIENEFEEIQKRAKEFLQNVQDENLISSFANKNLQKAKKLAIDSENLSRLLNKDDSDSSGDSEKYIINALKVFLTRSILFYQSLFEPLLKNPLLTENELRAYVDNPNVFSFKGEYWQVNFNGEETWVQNLERIRYIVHLLEHPNKEFYCYELTKMVKMIQPEINENYSSMGEDELAREGLNLVDLPIENLTKEEKARLEAVAYNIWRKFRDSQHNIDQSVEKAKEEWESVKKHLLNEYGILVASSNNGLFFKINARLKSEFEKARSNATKNIKNAIKSIRKQIPSLATHLTNAIHTGAKCCYRPDPMIPIQWTIKWND